MSGACHVVQGLGDVWNLLRKPVKSQVFISTMAPTRSRRCKAAPTPWGPPQSCPTITKFSSAQLVDERNQVGDVMRQRERGIDARMIGVPRADPVGRDGAIAGVHQGIDEVAIEKTPGRIAREQQHRSGDRGDRLRRCTPCYGR